MVALLHRVLEWLEYDAECSCRVDLPTHIHFAFFRKMGVWGILVRQLDAVCMAWCII